MKKNSKSSKATFEKSVMNCPCLDETMFVDGMDVTGVLKEMLKENQEIFKAGNVGKPHNIPYTSTTLGMTCDKLVEVHASLLKNQTDQFIDLEEDAIEFAIKMKRVRGVFGFMVVVLTWALLYVVALKFAVNIRFGQ